MSSEEQNAGAKPPPGARFFSEQERTDHVANVMEALTKQVPSHHDRPETRGEVPLLWKNSLNRILEHYGGHSF